jgi:hypothetical protein
MASKLKASDSPIFREDGTIRGLNYCKPSTRRGAVISFNAPNDRRQKGLRTTYMVDGDDFRFQYGKMVERIAEHYAVPDNSPIRTAMRSSIDAFLQRSNLRLVEVRYEQAVPIDPIALSHQWTPPGAKFNPGSL